ncbi:Fimbrial assembly [Rubrobacter xylanophilus DSM 9941]|uniref:Fimbrial assembly n=1 Tax=Rubrobacter xylanophilus (strain DSM 9941 / JCM 11954 / NBRC 16129 / PRD-1) TaxID=266117 RepID=Q1AW02_RUBXD|nr:fimbrial assembly [Rubrobacter xylanophilus]ABG04426.1 Fimbrial assembly [Rubrobacter xylanophilus DSM 9941]
MRRINLLPPEERRRGLERLRGQRAAGLLLVGGAAALLVVGLVALFLVVRIYMVESRIAELDARIAEQNRRLEALSPYRGLQARIEEKKPVADGIYRSRFQWAEFLQGLAFVIPTTTALETMSAEASPVDIDAPVGQPLEPPGRVVFTGVALPEYRNVADFVVRMDNLRFLANTRLESAELDRQTFIRPALSFEAESELVTEVGAAGTELRLEGLEEQASRAGGAR